MFTPRRLVVIALTVALVASGAVLVAWLRPAPPSDFYAAPDALDDAVAGELLRSEPFTTAVPDGAVAWRVLYASRDYLGAPIAVSGLVLAPAEPSVAPRPVLAVAHGSTGIDSNCAPSLSARPFASMPGVREALDAGWVVVATDYPGLGTPGPHPYLVGQSSAHAVIDSIRAATSLVDADPSRTAVWGFSQGGHAALFAIEAAAEVPDIDLVGAVLFAPATDLAGLIEAGQGSVAGTLLLVTTAVSWSEVYPELELDDVMDAEVVDDARAIAVRCLDATSLPASVVRSIRLRDALASLDDPRALRWASAVADNTPTAPVDVPVLVLHGDDDLLISLDVTAAHVADRCGRGEPVELRVVPGAGHFTVIDRAVDDALAWTSDRLRGRSLDHDCPASATEVDEVAADEPPAPGGPPTDALGSHGARPRPDWLGTRPLPLSPSGFGEVRATPPELRDRRLITEPLLPPPADEGFHATVQAPGAQVLARSTWHADCPVAAEDLRYLTVSFRGFDGANHTGELLVHADVADDVVEVFRILHASAFPIEQMRIVTPGELVAPPTGDGNNTTAFVCRTTVSGVRWSDHAFGRAIDVNPFHNPYLRGDVVLPELASAYLDRDDVRPGMITPDDDVVRAFASIGWGWGGDWRESKDWMHFSLTGR